MRNILKLMVTCGALVLSLGLGACGGGLEGEICNKTQQCMGGNPNDQSACVALYQGYANRAAAYRCSASYDTYASCLNQKGSCQNILVGKLFSAAGSCDSEFSAWDSCEKAASATK